MSHTGHPHHIHKIIHPFTLQVDLSLSLVGAVIYTSLMLLGNIYTETSILNTQFHTLLLVIANFLLFFILFLFNFSVVKHEPAYRYYWLIAILGTILITASYTFFLGLVRLWIYNEPFGDKLLYINMVKDGIAALTVLSITFSLFGITRRQQVMLENEQLRSENLQVRLTSLETQVDPHFLFNSLNTLDGLVGVDDHRAHRYLHQLASCYRYIIHQQRCVTLSEELAFTQDYTQLMQIRYGDNLKVEQHIDSQCLTSYVVPISLQLLMENAIKHNVVSDRHPLIITIETTPRNTLRVSNLCQPKDADNSSVGVGLANLSNRYQLLFHQDISISNDANLFSVEIPLISNL